MKMNKQLKALIIACVCLLMLPAVAFAVGPLPTPTYGWNMGNTLEPPCGEGCWGGVASQALINAVADAGFNAVRIPCAWDSNADTSNQIDPVYMARVNEVVDWCYARNLTVIINCHWDGGWFENCGFRRVDSKITAKLQSYWTQIASNFVNYDDRLLFACANEPAADTQPETDVLLQYYQTFIDTVRATGGQNTSRWLVLSGPATNIDYTDSFMNILPNDPTPDRLMVEIHDYSPYNFTIMSADESWGNMFYFWGQGYHHPTRIDRNPTWGEEDYIQAEHLKMYNKFTSQGIPVILGEFGATKRSGYPDLTGWDYDLHLAARTYWFKTVLDTANSSGMKPFCWDIPGGSGLFDWNTGAVLDQGTVTALTGGPALPPPSGGTNNPPSVSITSPANGATFTAGANITINATASDSDGTVTKVDFYRGTTLLGTDTTSPYSFTWNNAPEGSYTLTAKATDDNLAVTTSAPVGITVNPAGSTADIYVFNIAMSSRSAGINYFGQATVWIKDDTGANVSGATVYGTWSGGVSGSASGVTATDGTVMIESPALKKGGTFTFTVTNVVKSGSIYNAALNIETSDSITAP